MANLSAINPLLNKYIYDVAEWDGVMSARVKLTARDDGYDRRSSCWEKGDDGPVFDIEKFQSRTKRNKDLRHKQAKFVLNGILANEVTFLEFFARDQYDSSLKVRVFYSQVQMMLDNRAVIYSGRATGKTWTIMWNTLHRAVNFPGSQIMMWSHDDAHVNPRAKEIFKLIDSSKFFQQLIPAKNESGRSRKPPYEQNWLSGHQTFWVYPGSEGKQLEKFHVDGSVADESQELQDIHLEKWEPTQNDFLPSRGSIRKFFGVNTQGRRDTPFYKMTFHDLSYKGRVYVVPSWNNPREYSVKKHDEYLNRYDQNIDTPKFKQMIRGERADKTAGVFPARHYENCCEVRRRLEEEFNNHLPYRKRRYDDTVFDRRSLIELLPLPLAMPTDVKDIRIGMDYGHGIGGPTIIEVWFLLDQQLYDHDVWHLGEHIELVTVKPSKQAELMHYLINRVGAGLYPTASYVGIDVTGNLNIYSSLTDVNDSRFNDPINSYLERLVPIHFECPIVVGKSLEKPPDGVRSRKNRLEDGSIVWDIYEDNLPFSTGLIVDRMGMNGYSLPDEDEHRKNEFIGMIQIGKKFFGMRGVDHTIASNRCFEITVHEKKTLNELALLLMRRAFGDDGMSGGFSILMDFENPVNNIFNF